MFFEIWGPKSLNYLKESVEESLGVGKTILTASDSQCLHSLRYVDHSNVIKSKGVSQSVGNNLGLAGVGKTLTPTPVSLFFNTNRL